MVNPSQFPAIESRVVVALKLLHSILQFCWKRYRRRVDIVDGPGSSLKEIRWLLLSKIIHLCTAYLQDIDRETYSEFTALLLKRIVELGIQVTWHVDVGKHPVELAGELVATGLLKNTRK